MQSILEQITDWLKSMIISGIMGNLSGSDSDLEHIQYHDGCL